MIKKILKTLLVAIVYLLFAFAIVILANLAFHFFPLITVIITIIMVLCYAYWLVNECWK